MRHQKVNLEYDKEFDNKLNERLLQIEKDKSIEINLEKKEAESKIQAEEVEKNKIIDHSEINNFNYDRYIFNSSLSSELKPVFTRKSIS